MVSLEKLYSNRRTGDNPSSEDLRSDYQRDFDRIIFSSAFRRLQNKTQVFPLPGSVFVHNRLTHSLEVASVGRSLGSLVGDFIAENRTLSSASYDFYKNSLYNVISSACLCHDIGNPAFGHSGEDAIASFFMRNESELKSFFEEKQWTDLVNFEGNANAIRVLTQQQNGKSEGGQGLTYSTLVSIAKYPCESVAKNKKFIHRKKIGFFQSEKEIFKKIASTSLMQKESEEPLIYKRHPFVWLVEAADDICYNIVDLEDAHRLGIVEHRICCELIVDLIESIDAKDADKIKDRLHKIIDKNDKIAYLRAKAIGLLTQEVAEIYNENLDLILKSELNAPLLDLTSEKVKESLKKIKEFSFQNIYNHYSVIEIENAGYNVMYELLTHFVYPTLTEKEKRKKYEENALKLIPKQFVYEGKSLYEQVMGIMDFVSGMTDNYATELYRKIKGIEIGMRR